MFRGNRGASVRASDRRDGISGRLGRRRGPSDVDIHGVLGDVLTEGVREVPGHLGWFVLSYFRVRIILRPLYNELF